MSLKWFLQFTGPYHTYSVCLSQIQGVLERPPVPLRPLPDPSPKYRVSSLPVTRMQLLGVPNGSDPDPHGSALVGWIRIQEGKNDTHKNEDSSFEVLGVSFEG